MAQNTPEMIKKDIVGADLQPNAAPASSNAVTRNKDAPRRLITPTKSILLMKARGESRNRGLEARVSFS